MAPNIHQLFSVQQNIPKSPQRTGSCLPVMEVIVSSQPIFELAGYFANIFLKYDFITFSLNRLTKLIHLPHTKLLGVRPPDKQRN